MEEVDEREQLGRERCVEHQHRVVVQKGKRSAHHGLVSAVGLHLRLKYSITRTYSVETALASLRSPSLNLR
jgi:hypothetical protein